MEIYVIASAVIVIAAVILITGRRSNSQSQKVLEMLNEQRTQIAIQNEKLERQSTDIERFRSEVSSNLQSSSIIIGDVKERFGEIMETTRQIHEVGKNISSLENILKSPKLRGNLGEYLLEELLSQVIPAEYLMKQYKFKSGDKVDFIIQVGEKLVSIDSKFPLENFKKYVECLEGADKERCYKEAVRDVKKHIDDISRKYILPDEGTFDFALMYIPAENVYYESIIKDGASELFGYSMDKKVIPVSPNSMYAYLQALLIGLKGLQVEKNASEILSKLGALKGDFGNFADVYEIVGTHLSNAAKRYEESARKLDKFEDKLENVIERSEEERVSLVS
jgi:DNA recombination protein RmuC